MLSFTAVLGAGGSLPEEKPLVPWGLIRPDLVGDVNGDGEVDALDASLVLQYDAKLIDGESLLLENADVNSDKEVDALDASLILQLDAKLIPGFFVNSILQLVNELRAENGLDAVVLDDTLCRVAQIKADDMTDNGYFDNISPTHGSSLDMLRRLGVNTLTSLSENIAKGQKTVPDVIKTWSGKPSQLSNMLMDDVTKMGVGYNPKENIWVQIFTD